MRQTSLIQRTSDVERRAKIQKIIFFTDESFGDFKFLSFPNQQLLSTSIQSHGWGNFVNHSNRINRTTSSKIADSFSVSMDPLKKSENNTNNVIVEAKKNHI